MTSLKIPALILNGITANGKDEMITSTFSILRSLIILEILSALPSTGVKAVSFLNLWESWL